MAPGPELLLVGGDVEPEPLAGAGLLESSAALMCIGETAAAGLICGFYKHYRRWQE